MRFLITGGAASSARTAQTILRAGTRLSSSTISRPGTGQPGLAQERHGERLQFVQGMRDYEAVAAVAPGADVILHLASQVAVTTSVADPRTDFMINALGTFNVLEAVRHHAPGAVFIYTSTNKVYGGMEDVRIVEEENRYGYADYPAGIPESFPLDFHSPYGCSKGTGDQYTLDYARIYGLRTVSFRQSCIYGPRQFGVEDQGWVAHFVIAAVMGRPITIYGDGKQVRDVLHVGDLIRAYELAVEKIDEIAGTAFNIGGGPENTLAVWKEFGPLLAGLRGEPLPVSYGPWRPGDQLVFVADISRARRLLGWQPAVDPKTGIAGLYRWVQQNRNLFR